MNEIITVAVLAVIFSGLVGGALAVSNAESIIDGFISGVVISAGIVFVLVFLAATALNAGIL